MEYVHYPVQVGKAGWWHWRNYPLDTHYWFQHLVILLLEESQSS